GAARLRAARGRLERQLTGLERRYPSTAAGVGVTLAWGLPYFRVHVPRSADGRRFPSYLPVDLRASKARGKRVSAVLDATRFASDTPDVVLGGDDVAALIRSDSVAHIDDAQKAIFDALDDVFTVTS